MGADRRQTAALRAGRDDRRVFGADRRGVLVSGAAARQRDAAVRADRRVPAEHAGARTLHLDDLVNAAAGDDDVDVLLPDADDLPVRVHLSDREHARRDPAADVSVSAALLPGDPALDLPQGSRPRNVVAAGARPDCLGCWDPGAGDRALVETNRLIQNVCRAIHSRSNESTTA